jgi:hypothetical protein
MRTSRSAPANPGATATATILDTGPKEAGAGDSRNTQRFRCVIYADQVVTFRHRWAAPGSSNLRVVNGAGSGEATTASVAKDFDKPLLPGRNVFDIVTTTGPTVWEVAAEVIDQSS